MTNSTHDRWLLPRKQTEYPGRDLLPESTLHGRREATFLVLSAMFFVATTALLLLGASRVIDGSALLAQVTPSVELPTTLLIPLVVVPLAISFIAGAMTYDLFGRKRATALLWTGFFACLALIGVMRVADLIDNGNAFTMAVALTAYYVVAHVFNLLGCAALRGRNFFLRVNVASVLAQAAGWSVAGLVLHAAGGFLSAPISAEHIIALTAGGAAGTALCVFVLAIPAAIATHALEVGLRVGSFEDEVDDDDGHEYDRREYDGHGYGHVAEPAHLAGSPAFAQGSVARKLPAMIVDDEDEVIPLEHPRRTLRGTIQPFSSAEMRFFTEGDALEH